MKQPAGGGGHRKKHARGGGSGKHHHNQPKHNPRHHPKPHHKPQKGPVHTVGSPMGLVGKGIKRGLALADGPACCPSEALAASLRLTGRPVSDSDVLTLHGHVRDATDAGASILATLEAAGTWGLGGVRPVSWAPASWGAALLLGVSLPGPHTVCVAPCGCWLSWGELHDPWTDEAEEAWEVTWPN